MEPATITVISLIIFGVASLFAAFIRQLILSRDKQLNEIAQLRSLNLETLELKKIRFEMATYRRLDSHYAMLGNNKEAIRYIDNRIHELLNEKMMLIQRYSEKTLKESSKIITGEKSEIKLSYCNHLREEIDKQIAFYDKEIEAYQIRRSHLWDADQNYQTFLLEEERRRNQRLDDVYQRHANLLTKIYLRHNEQAVNMTKHNLSAGTKTFKSAFMTPINFITNLFSKLPNVSSDKAKKESESRDEVSEVEDDINKTETEVDENDKNDKDDKNNEENEQEEIDIEEDLNDENKLRKKYK